MAGFILMCTREPAAARSRAADLRLLADRLTPPEITPAAPVLYDDEGLAFVVVNPVCGLRADVRGACLGSVAEGGDCLNVGSAPPLGTYAIVRHDPGAVELLTDVFATRTIWYFQDDEVFLASTSQRALVALLGTFELCREAATWMVAAGNLGPERGWDARLRRVPSAACLTLERHTWELSLTRDPVAYESSAAPAAEQLADLRVAIFDVCSCLDTDAVPAALTLSGGHDSRSLLVGLAHAGKRVRCVTWGLAASLADSRNDAAIARMLAGRFGMEFEYLTLDPGGVPAREAFTRFLEAGEGRIEDFSGYTDGFAAWRHLYESGLALVLRGDSPGWGFPFPPVNDFVTRSIVHEMTLVSDYPEGDLVRRLDLEPQRPPEGLFMREGESLDGYRDRIYNEYELPSCMAAFNVVKCAYLEVHNPLLVRTVAEVAARMPDDLRHMRSGFERMVGELVPDVPFATNGADEPLERYLSREAVVAELAGELSSADARRVFSANALDRVVDDLVRPASEARRRLRDRVRAVVPDRLIRAVRPIPRPHASTRAIAYRMYIASRMAAILADDAVTFHG